MRNGIEKFKNKYSGERCFLAGNGPSLAHTPLELLKEEYTFGVNKIADIYPMTTWRPSFYVNVANGVQFPAFAEAARVAIKDTVSFIGTDNLPVLFGTFRMQAPGTGQLAMPVIEDAYRVPTNVYPVNVTFKNYLPMTDTGVWSYDIAESVSKDGSSMFAVMQIAVYMGFNPIYLLGCDLGLRAFDWGGKDPNHFTEGYWGRLTRNNNEPYRFTEAMAIKNTAHILTGHTSAKDVCDRLGVDVYNATVGGELEVYPRVDLREII